MTRRAQEKVKAQGSDPASRPEDAIGTATLRWLRDFAAGGIITTDAALRVVSWNRWLVNATGIPEQAAIGRPLLEVLPERRGEGIGTELVRRLLAELEDLYMVDLMCDPELEPFYRRFEMVPLSGMGLRRRHVLAP